MASIRHNVVIGAPAAVVWDVLRDVGAVHRRLLPGRVADCRIEGDERVLTFPDGHVVRERIIDVDDDRRRLAYAVVEGARPAVEFHHATFEVQAEGTGASRLIWTTDVMPHSLAEPTRIRMERGAEEMRQTIEAGAPGGTPVYQD
jgi:uncharacterized protein YndB with AHSA1/START domain